MEALLVLIVIILSTVLVVLTIKYNGKKEELYKLTMNMQDLAHKQYQAWVASDSQTIRTQQLDLARREAAAALEEWKSSSELAIRNDAIQRSQSVILVLQRTFIPVAGIALSDACDGKHRLHGSAAASRTPVPTRSGRQSHAGATH
jgi:predicted Holliday junction resolvase-like endonuclease